MYWSPVCVSGFFIDHFIDHVERINNADVRKPRDNYHITFPAHVYMTCVGLQLQVGYWQGCFRELCITDTIGSGRTFWRLSSTKFVFLASKKSSTAIASISVIFIQENCLMSRVGFVGNLQQALNYYSHHILEEATVRGGASSHQLFPL